MSDDAGSEESPRFLIRSTEKTTVRSDTTHPIPVRPCETRTTSQNSEEENGDSSEKTEDKISSLHELTCRWAIANDLRTDSTRLPKYVRPTGDTLRLSDEALIYLVEMDSPFEDRGDTYFEDEYLVGEVGDSLFYEGYVSVRGMWEVEVPGTDTRYIWLESVRSNSDSTEVTWWGRIFTYDRQRGIQYAARAPVRFEMFEDGESIGHVQVDVSIPEPGIMKIEWREVELPTRLATRSNFHNWIGPHVIDTTETDKRNLR